VHCISLHWITVDSFIFDKTYYIFNLHVSIHGFAIWFSGDKSVTRSNAMAKVGAKHANCSVVPSAKTIKKSVHHNIAILLS